MRPAAARAVALAPVVAALLATGCSGSGSTAGSPSAAAPSGSAAPAVSAGPATGSASAGAGAAASARASAASATAGAAATAAAPPPATAAKPPGQPTGFTRAGTYTYDVSGTSTTPLGTQPIRGTASLAVDPPASGRQHSRMAGSSGQGSQDETVASRPSGLFVVDLHIHQQGFDEDFRPVGSAMYFPADYRVGRSWSWAARSTDGSYRIDVTSTISGTATERVGRSSLRTLVVDSVLHISGSNVDVTDHQRDWVSTAYALVVRDHAVTSGKVGGFAISSDVTQVLRSTTPS